jgi:hypothetical protein
LSDSPLSRICCQVRSICMDRAKLRKLPILTAGLLLTVDMGHTAKSLRGFYRFLITWNSRELESSNGGIGISKNGLKSGLTIFRNVRHGIIHLNHRIGTSVSLPFPSPHTALRLPFGFTTYMIRPPPFEPCLQFIESWLPDRAPLPEND